MQDISSVDVSQRLGWKSLYILNRSFKNNETIQMLNFRSSPEKLSQLLHDTIIFTLDFANDLSLLHIH